MNFFVKNSILVCIFIMALLPVFAQGQKKKAPAVPAIQEEIMTPQQFTEFLKQVWIYVKEAVTATNASVEKKNEFETTGEYGQRILDARRQFIARMDQYSAEQKLSKRLFLVQVKAKLNSYNADKKEYIISPGEIIDAPYNIPQLQSKIKSNRYVGLTDSVSQGYRITRIYIKLPKNYKWSVRRDDARDAKIDEESVYFQIPFYVSLRQEKFAGVATITYIPKELALVNKKTNKIYWRIIL